MEHSDCLAIGLSFKDGQWLWNDGTEAKDLPWGRNYTGLKDSDHKYHGCVHADSKTLWAFPDYQMKNVICQYDYDGKFNMFSYL